MTNKPFVLADIKDLINQLDLEEISMSRLTEILNEKAELWVKKQEQKQAITDIMNDDERDGLYDDKNQNL